MTCGIELPDQDDAEHRTPCRTCGATARKFEVNLAATVSVSAHFMMEAQREGRTVGFRESERAGRAASGDDHGEGSVSMTLTGTSPQGEEDTLPACRMLVRTMNGMGDSWSEPSEGTDDIDCVATNETNATVTPLHIQVVRAIVDPGIWRSLASAGTLERPNLSVEEVIDLLSDAVQKKLVKIPPKQRPGLVLALDATRFPVMAFDSVVDRFQEKYGSSVAAAGFRSVWIVGPTESLTKRLAPK